MFLPSNYFSRTRISPELLLSVILFVIISVLYYFTLIRHAGSLGASGQRMVRRGKRQAGHMGPDPRTTVCKVSVQRTIEPVDNGSDHPNKDGLMILSQVFRIETMRDLIFLKGSIPSPVGKVVTIWDGRGSIWVRNK